MLRDCCFRHMLILRGVLQVTAAAELLPHVSVLINRVLLTYNCLTPLPTAGAISKCDLLPLQLSWSDQKVVQQNSCVFVKQVVLEA